MQGSTIIVATDLSDNARPAAVWASEVGRLTGMPVVVTHVIEIGFDSWLHSKYEIGLNEAQMADARNEVAQWFEMATGEPPGGLDLRIDYVVTGITDAVEQYDGALLVMAPSGKGAVERAVLGSRVQQLASRPPCPLVIVDPNNPRFESPLKIGIALDFSAASLKALDCAGSLAAMTKGDLVLLYALEAPRSLFGGGMSEEDLVQAQGDAETQLKQLASMHLPDLESVRVEVLRGEVAPELMRYAREQQLDVLVVGQTGHTSLARDFIGSTPRRLVRELTETLIIVPTATLQEETEA